MTKTLKKGEKVSWATSNGKTDGTVEKVVTSPTKIKGYVAKASKTEPQVLVKSSRTGKQAIHKAQGLTKT